MISKNWTDEERLKIVLILAGMIQSDILAGRYGAVVEEENGVPVRSRPNMQAIIEMVIRPSDHLEEHRLGIESLVLERLGEIGQTPEEFWGTPLEDARQMIFGVCPRCGEGSCTH